MLKNWLRAWLEIPESSIKTETQHHYEKETVRELQPQLIQSPPDEATVRELGERYDSLFENVLRRLGTLENSRQHSDYKVNRLEKGFELIGIDLASRVNGDGSVAPPVPPKI